jgi:hypothetical protein
MPPNLLTPSSLDCQIMDIKVQVLTIKRPLKIQGVKRDVLPNVLVA